MNLIKRTLFMTKPALVRPLQRSSVGKRTLKSLQLVTRRHRALAANQKHPSHQDQSSGAPHLMRLRNLEPNHLQMKRILMSSATLNAAFRRGWPDPLHDEPAQEDIGKRRRLQAVDHHAQADLFELCCSEDSNLTKIINQKGGHAMRLTLENGYDWTDPETIIKAIELFHLHNPKMVRGSPLCGPFSSVQNLNQKDEAQCADLELKREYSRKMIVNVFSFLEYALVVFEHPLTASSWQKIPQLAKFRAENHECRVDGWQLGVVDNETGEPMLKPWRIVSNSASCTAYFQIRCLGRHQRVQCLDGTPKVTESYTVKFAKRVRHFLTIKLRCKYTKEQKEHVKRNTKIHKDLTTKQISQICKMDVVPLVNV